MNIDNIKEENDGITTLFAAPDRLITLFADEMRELGLEFSDCDEIVGFMHKRKDVILSVAIKYYRMAREEQNDEAENYFLGFFEHKGYCELVPMLIEAYSDAHTWDATRWFIAECLYVIEGEKYISEYIKLVLDRSLGLSRQKIIALLGKIGDERMIPALIELLEDRDVRAYALAALSGLEKPELRPHFERFKDAGIREYFNSIVDHTRCNRYNHVRW